MRSPGSAPAPAAQLLREARASERTGCLAEAIAGYEAAIGTAEQDGERPVLAEALRRLAVVRFQRGEAGPARELCGRSHEVARGADDPLLAAEALITLGGLDLSTGALGDARRRLDQAAELAGQDRRLQARVEQNLGILATIRGELTDALAHYERSLAAYRATGDEHGCALAYHNMGMVFADRGQFDSAEAFFRESRTLAERIGDAYLRALCLVNHAEVQVARQHFEDARQNGEIALALFDQLGTPGPKADAYRVLGMVFRETGRPALAECRLRSAIALAAGAGAVLGEAEAYRELAILCQGLGRNQEALRHLHAAHERFRLLDARTDVVHVGAKLAALEGTYLAVVREWGRSIESRDAHTFGHCERVAQHAVAIAQALRLDAHEEKTVLLGAYLHDVGKVRVPPELLHKSDPLTPEEEALLRQHPRWGVDLLADVDFPWDLKPIVLWHHERYDGSGYPDGLRGDDIPLTAQIVGIADAFDLLITDVVRGQAVPVAEAVEQMVRQRQQWAERVFEAFRRVVAPAP